jgi:hypothetical protein
MVERRDAYRIHEEIRPFGRPRNTYKDKVKAIPLQSWPGP